MPQVIGNKRKWKEAIEGLERSRELAKQVLSQLSYTPTLQLIYFKSFPHIPKFIPVRCPRVGYPTAPTRSSPAHPSGRAAVCSN